MSFLYNALLSSWSLLNQSAVYMLFGLLIGGLLKEYLSPAYVATQLGSGRFSSVFKSALLGIPIPLCSCGVLPAAATLKKQGANNGAVTAFLISTPESGVDSISITWALLDPIMTVARPVSAFISAAIAGIAENLFSFSDLNRAAQSGPVEQKTTEPCVEESSCGCGCGSAEDASTAGPTEKPEKAQRHGFIKDFPGKLKSGLIYAITDIWEELAGWFLLGLLLAGAITVLLPDELFATYLSGGLSSMFIMLVIGIPLYICATASTPIAAAFILKGVSPGAALVFLLVGPATNITSLSVLVGLLGRRGVALYLTSIAVVSLCCGLALDAVYRTLDISIAASVTQHGKMLPEALTTAASLVLLALSVRPVMYSVQRRLKRKEENDCCSHDHEHNHHGRGTPLQPITDLKQQEKK